MEQQDSGAAGATSAVSVGAAQAMELQDLVDGMDRASDASDPDAYLELNVRFHQCILSFARNRQAEALYGDFTKKLLLFRRRSFDREGNMARSNAEHRGPSGGDRRGPEPARARAGREPRACRPRPLSGRHRMRQRSLCMNIEDQGETTAWHRSTTGSASTSADE